MAAACLRYAACLLTLTFSLAASLLVLCLAYNDLRQDGMAAARLVEQRLSGVFNGLLAQSTPPLVALDHDCDAFVGAARQQILRNPYLRSVSLMAADRQTLVCSTVSGRQPIRLAHHPHPQRLFYLADSPLVPGTSALVLAYPYADGQMFYGINMLLLRAIFPERQDYLQVYIQVGNALLTASGALDSPPRYGGLVARNHFFATGFAYDLPGLFRYALYHYLAYWLLLQAGALLVYRLIRRQQSGEARMRRDIAQGLARQQFMAYVQPIFSRDGALSGAEVLLRWQHHRRGFIPPDTFIDVAEASGQINRLFGVLVQQLEGGLLQAGLPLPPGFQLGMNVCAQQLGSAALLHDCRRLQRRLQALGGELVLELTERARLPDDEHCYQALDTLKRLGVRIAMDDFGTGHSSLIYLTRMQVDCLKIDRSFVSQIRQGQPGDIVANVLDLARRLGMETVAEGVETAYQHCRLVEMGVDRLQGYHFARPMPLDEFVECYLLPLAGGGMPPPREAAVAAAAPGAGT